MARFSLSEPTKDDEPSHSTAWDTLLVSTIGRAECVAMKADKVTDIFRSSHMRNDIYV